jgi:L-alanine-DL-glutamate epimerase-like enolase superfamily enzyme
MTIRVRHGDLHLLDLRTRMPFKYGIATMTSTPHAFVRLEVEVDGRRSAGIAADHLPPKWFTKDPDQVIAAEIAEMLRVIEHALQVAAGIRGDSPFDAWRQLWEAQADWGRGEALPPLLTHFGTSLVERALLEAFCRAKGRPFAQLLRRNEVGVRLGDLHPSLRGLAPADLLPGRPLTEVLARHTVGLADPLVDSDIVPADRLDDGLPQSLAACIQAYGLRHFKIKVNGQTDRDLDRLRRVAAVIESHAAADYAFSLDGNEQFHALAPFQSFWEEINRSPDLRRFFAHLLFVEQPFHRDVALQPAVMAGMADWPTRPPLIIDESDAELDSLARALGLGYAGTSHKNCKGVFKGIANACLLAHLRRQQPDRPLLLSGEDLANIGPVALLQDLVVDACLGIASVERNGHHYFAGLSMFPPDVQRQVLEAHGDLYHAGRDGWPTLTVTDGALQLGSVLEAPFGVGPVVNVEQFPTLEEYRHAHRS